MTLHHVKELLIHASISTADTYLNAPRVHLHESMLRLEAMGKVCAKFAQNPPPGRRTVLGGESLQGG